VSLLIFDVARYSELLRAVASLSRLYSENTVAYVDSRFVERLFIRVAGARDLSRTDKSFDALIEPDIGVGIKTFLGGTGNSKREKVAEFTTFAREGEFLDLSQNELMQKVSTFRNNRVLSDARELGVSLEKSVYHCLVRIATGAVIHEEPYGLIDMDSLILAPKPNNGMHFADKFGRYNYNVAKNVLLKEFVFNRNTNFIELPIHEDIFERVLEFSRKSRVGVNMLGESVAISSDSGEELIEVLADYYEIPGVDYVVLPLYSLRGAVKTVQEKSGINQWNAGGRPRTFGEAYVPIPIEVHRLCPKFFPDRDSSFALQLPDRRYSTRAKVCQENSKALMSDPNTALGHWILKVIDPVRADREFVRPPSGHRPYVYEDLIRIGKDAVKVSRKNPVRHRSYAIEFAQIGAYEEFLGQVQNVL